MKQDRMAWMRGLKVGDTVCDCRYKHLKIASIEEEIYPWRWIHTATRWTPLPVYYFFQAVARLLRMTSLQGKELTLEDGACCSALSCCDPAEDHTEESHAEELEEFRRRESP
jgi:hypothetical protein